MNDIRKWINILCEDREIITEAVTEISAQQAKDQHMFGPMYHGTTHDLGEIIKQGFDTKHSIPTDIGYMNRPVGTSHGMPLEAYAGGIAAPIHWLGMGTYFTTVKAIAKKYAGGTMKGQKQFYLDSQNIAKINFGSPNTMMKWWIQNGYNMTSESTQKRDFKAWVSATKNLTERLSSQYDAVHYLGKGLYKLLDGDQVCVYDTSLIRVINPKLSTGLEIGNKVTHTQIVKDYGKHGGNSVYVDDIKPDDFGKASALIGWKGIFRGDESDEELANRKSRGLGRYPIHFIPPPNMVGIITDVRNVPQTGKKLYDVKWQKGGQQYNYSEDELKPK